MKRVAITGIDGTGKTTLVRLLRQRFRARPAEAVAFHAPQYHEDPDAPFGELSARIDALSVLADRAGDPLLKASALFLSVTLFGPIEEHYARAFAPRTLYSERHPIVDTLSYAAFYRQLLRAPWDRARAEKLIREGVGSLEPVEAWLSALAAQPGPLQGATFWELPARILSIVEQEPAALHRDLARAYRTRLPDELVVLTVELPALERRLAAKAQGSAPRELHEKRGTLELLQGALLAGARALAEANPGMRLRILDTSAQSPEESLGAILG
jgi:hypothetical protein